MSLQHFFLSKQVLSESIELSNNCGFELDLSKEDFYHAKVLRLKKSEHIGVIDANNVFYNCQILEITDKLIVKNCIKEEKKCQQNEIYLCAGVSKANKLDNVIRACTEIGIDGFMPTMFERSVVKLDKKKQQARIDRWKNIIKSASMQSGQVRLSSITNILDFDNLIQCLQNFDYIFVFWEESNDMKSIINTCSKIKDMERKKIAIVIGPEGGISENEIEKFKQCNIDCNVVSIGNSILRTETASVVAPGIIKFLVSC